MTSLKGFHLSLYLLKFWGIKSFWNVSSFIFDFRYVLPLPSVSDLTSVKYCVLGDNLLPPRPLKHRDPKCRISDGGKRVDILFLSLSYWSILTLLLI